MSNNDKAFVYAKVASLSSFGETLKA